MNIKDYLHLYLGCFALTTKPTYENPQVGVLDQISLTDGEACITADDGYYLCGLNEVKPLLRPLSDLTAIESEDMDVFRHRIRQNDLIAAGAHMTRYLLSRGFDLFGLIDAGLALDKTLTP
jgi:hypothetical protein